VSPGDHSPVEVIPGEGQYVTRIPIAFACNALKRL
jgi:hypothetical protein